MSAIHVTYNRGAVKPLECLRGGWNLIKDQYWLFLGITAVGILIGSFGPMAILLAGPSPTGRSFQRKREEMTGSRSSWTSQVL